MSTLTTTVELTELRPAPAPADRETISLKVPQDTHNALPESGTSDSAASHELSTGPLASELSPTSMLRVTLTVLQPSLVNFLSSFTNGLITVGLPAIAKSLSLQRSLYVWPASVYGLTAGSMLLIAGSIADLVGPRRVELLGIFLLGLFFVAGGLSTSGTQVVVFRALQGIAMALHLPASVALVAAGVPEGRARNVAFACLGLSQPLGFSVGLVASGVMIERVGWRAGFFVSGAATLVAAVVAVWMLPKPKPVRPRMSRLRLLESIYTEIDWIGGALASGGLALLAYVLACVLSAY